MILVKLNRHQIRDGAGVGRRVHKNADVVMKSCSIILQLNADMFHYFWL